MEQSSRSSILARALLVSAAFALAWQRPDALLPLAGVTRHNQYQGREKTLTSTALRHLELFDRGADKAFEAHVGWLISRPWRESIPPLATEDLVRAALAEVDIISGCLITACRRRERGLYSAGLAQPGQIAQQRLVSRVRDTTQRAALCTLFSVPADALEATLEEAYSHLTAGNRWHSGEPGLFSER